LQNPLKREETGIILENKFFTSPLIFIYNTQLGEGREALTVHASAPTS